LKTGRIFAADEARHFRFGRQIDRNEYNQTHEKFHSMEVYLLSRDFLKFLEITANISETVPDRDIVTMEDQ